MSDISHQIWDMKYWLKGPDGTPVDRDVADSWTRVAMALAQAEAPDQRVSRAQEFAHAQAGHKFMPAGRILAGAGTGRSVTLFNCFVMGTIEDSMDGIFSALREAALSLQQGGGIGYDFSSLRPKGALVHGVDADASGPASFMDVWDSMCRTIMSAGSRRGAMMATLRVDHPDIEDFITAKRTQGRLSNFNLSVLVSDAFMTAVKNGDDWRLQFDGRVYRTVKARALWDIIMRATYDHAEPGVVFIDRINQQNNPDYCETIAATNSCGEKPLPPYGACLLGSINLAKLVRQPFTDGAALDMAELERLVGSAVRMMDNAIDVSRFPLDAQAQEARAKRRIGLGVTGLADPLILCKTRYGSPQSLELTRFWLAAVSHAAYRASVELARGKGPFPLYDMNPYLSRPHIQALPPEIYDGIAAHGIRNALLTSIAPTGIISLFADNVSSGIEPVFAFNYTRKVLQPDGSRREVQVSDYALRLFQKMFGTATPLPDYFVTAQTLSPSDHLAVQAAAQPFIDSAISKTINVPTSISFEDFAHVYLEAYDLGCKGCTTYRPNDVTGSVLSVEEPPPAAQSAANSQEPELPLPPAAARRQWRHRLYDPAAGPTRRAAGPHLQDQMAGQQSRFLHHHQRHRERRAPQALRGVHQFQEHGSLCLGAGPDPHDLGGIPARRPMDKWPLCAVPAGGHRRGDRAPHDGNRLHGPAPSWPVGPAGRPQYPRRRRARALLPALRRCQLRQAGGLRLLFVLRLFQMQLVCGA